MLDAGFSLQLHDSRLRHRATRAANGSVVYRLADGSGHVSLSEQEWDAIGTWFHDQARRIRRRANWLYAGLLPGIMIFALTIGQLLSFAGLVIVAALFGGPVAIYLWQSHRIAALARRIDRELVRCPRAAAPPPDRARPPHWLDICAMLLVGPGLIVAAVGEIGGPDTFRNTPLVGTHFGPMAWAGLAVLVLRLCWAPAHRALAR